MEIISLKSHKITPSLSVAERKEQKGQENDKRQCKLFEGSTPSQPKGPKSPLKL